MTVLLHLRWSLFQVLYHHQTMSDLICYLSKQQLRHSNCVTVQSATAVAAYEPSQGTPRLLPNTNWQTQSTQQVEQLQRRITCLENDLRRNQNPRHSANRSCGQLYRGWNDEYYDEYLSPPFYNQHSMSNVEAPLNSNQENA